MKLNILKGILIAGTIVTLFSFDVPKNWFVAGSVPKSYEMGIGKGEGQNGSNAATIKSVDKKPNGFGTLMQNCRPDKFLGKRVRMSGYMKSRDVSEWAGFWLRVDQEGSQRPLAFDNMGSRPVKGTTDWAKYEIVLDVPANASNIAFGALLDETGQIWFDNIKFEIVDNSVPVTGDEATRPKAGDEPANLDFEN